MTDRLLEVLDPGARTTVQDRGRPGWAHLGVPRSGAVDRPALELANRLVGNPGEAAGLETTLTGCSVRPSATVTVAVTGAPADVRVGGRVAAWGLPVTVRAGELLEVGAARGGVHSYLAVGGGVLVEPVLGSRSTDTLSPLGPPPLRGGDTLPFGPATGLPAGVDIAVPRPVPARLALRIRLGPRDDWFTAEARTTLLSATYEVTSHADRVGARLAGPPLERAVTAELPSEGLVLGAVQVPADGQPLVFLADHPTTGGYPVIGVVSGADLPLLAQAVPGTGVCFTTRGAR